MADILDADRNEDFADAFGDALNNYILDRGMNQSDLVELLGMDKKIGKSRISTYCRDGRRVKPDAEFFWLACSRLPDFSFVYKGYRVSAATLNGKGAKVPKTKSAEQLTFEFDRQFNLAGKQGTIAVKVKRPQGRFEVSVSLEARAS